MKTNLKDLSQSPLTNSADVSVNIKENIDSLLWFNIWDNLGVSLWNILGGSLSNNCLANLERGKYEKD